MSVRMWLLGVGVATVVAALGAQACGGEEDAPAATPGVDSGTDAGTGVAPGTPDAASGTDATACDPTADFTKDIPDAAIGDGGATSGLCLGCVKTKCAASITACAQHCPCQESVGGLLECYVKNSANPLICATSISNPDTTTTGIALQLLPCVQTSCPDECGVVNAGLPF